MYLSMKQVFPSGCASNDNFIWSQILPRNQLFKMDFMLNLLFQHTYEVRPSLSMKILSINNFTTLLLGKLFSDLSIGVHLKGTKKFVSYW